MVYQYLEIIAGFEIDHSELTEKLGLDEEIDNTVGDAYVEENCLEALPIQVGPARQEVRLLNFPCHSAARGHKYVLGIQVHLYYRHFIRCPNCPELAVCDVCIGNTNNGVYDVQDICDRPTEIEPEHVCGRCFADNRRAVDHQNPCRDCRLEESVKDRNKSITLRELRKLGNFYDLDKPLGFYYMIDGCLSCS